MTIPFPPEREQAKFQRALDFLTERVSEGRLDIILSYESFLALEQKKIEYFGDARYPNIGYDSSMSRVTIKR
ncbi:hypothetical protein V1522DRAFT_423849 [Lipomyces starkeyi]